MTGRKYKKYSKILFHVILPLLGGIVIYGLFRGIHFIDPTENFFPLASFRLPEWTVNNLPDGLWFYSFISAITLIWQDNSSSLFLWWLLLIIILVYLTEIFQALHFIEGTFDWYDLISYTIALSIYIFNFKPSLKQLLLNNQKLKT